ncbi:MAG: hypothetical protein PHT59_02455 [Candidatus Omnitrophica bacterium]|nr:hypothetical protein [Candidatus Omnitrophota bacterium]
MKRLSSLFLFFASVLLLCPAGAFAQDAPGYDSQGKPDPFIPWVTEDGRLQILVSEQRQGSAAEELKVEGIIFDKRGLSYAVINNEIVKIGDLIEDYQVLRIEESKVILIREGQPKEIILEEEGL